MELKLYTIVVLLLSICFLGVLGVALHLLIEGYRLEKTILKLHKMQKGFRMNGLKRNGGNDGTQNKNRNRFIG